MASFLRTHVIYSLIVAILLAGLQTVLATAAHLAHPAKATQLPLPGEPDNNDTDGDHCCHLAVHLLGAVTDPVTTPLQRSNRRKDQPRGLRLGTREPPPEAGCGRQAAARTLS
jgi:hypothetical protein